MRLSDHGPVILIDHIIPVDIFEFQVSGTHRVNCIGCSLFNVFIVLINTFHHITVKISDGLPGHCSGHAVINRISLITTECDHLVIDSCDICSQRIIKI